MLEEGVADFSGGAASGKPKRDNSTYELARSEVEAFRDRTPCSFLYRC